ncbi:MAG: hypothetical protein IJX33_04235 [Akkermansia sp.]|nr:hypothetical protein [Akkermansia sp.]
MAHIQEKTRVAGSMLWALLRPVVVVLGGLLMLLMLVLLSKWGELLKNYWQSERVYTASAETIDPSMEGHLVRVTGALCTDESVSAGNLDTYTGVIEVQKHTTIAYAGNLQLGARQVQGLHTFRQSPFGYFAINTPGVDWVEAGDKRLALLRSGAEVSLLGRQRGNVLDMAEPGACANLGKAPASYIDHVDVGLYTDISLRTFHGIGLFALVVYLNLWPLLGLAVGSSALRGLTVGVAILLLVCLCIAVIP